MLINIQHETTQIENKNTREETEHMQHKARKKHKQLPIDPPPQTMK